ncbi:MAG: hypothetical protein OXG78_12345 [Chloroflexi bacterium]|nr:hypothetical protein [Chloroflexota bacterium]
MRYLHPVQAHEVFVAGGEYRFFKDGRTLDKTETWVIHEHPDGGRFTRIDVDARRSEGKSILVEALQGGDGQFLRLDIRYENAQFEGGIKDLRASYQFAGSTLRVGYNLNGAERQYAEVKLLPDALIDIPLLIFRGSTIETIAEWGEQDRPLFVLMYEHAQLFPGTLKLVGPAAEFAGEDNLVLGKRHIPVRRYTYRNQALAYWIDRHSVVIKRVNAFKGQEFVVKISNYAMPPG